MRTPREAGVGKALVTYSFDAWKEGDVRPTTIELPVVASAPADEVPKPHADEKRPSVEKPTKDSSKK